MKCEFINKSNLLKLKKLPFYISIVFTALLLFYLILGIYIMASGCLKTPITASVQQNIANEMLRFHVIANSDLEQDQSIKLLVKDEIINYLKPFLEQADTKKAAEDIILSHIEEIPSIAESKLKEMGFEYSVTASLEVSYFPIKTYGDISLPAGNYDALLIKLGNAKGQNWWCIMFPRLCFIDGICSVVPDASKTELKYLLTEEEYEAILTEPEITYKFKLLQWIEELLH